MSKNIKGLDSLLRKVNKLKEVKLEKIMEAAAEKVRGEARINVKNLASFSDGGLSNSIFTRVENNKGVVKGVVYTNLEYATYFEFGTGPVGQDNHDGISPDVTPVYSPTGWYVRTSDFPTYHRYGFEPRSVYGEEMIFTLGQKAKPFLYPALHDNQKKIKEFIIKRLKDEIKGAIK